MTSTKVQKAGITDGSIGADQIEDGTIIASDIEDGSITNAKLTNSSFTLNGSSVSLGGSVSISVFVDWQSVITADGSTTTTAVAGNGYFIDTTSASHTINLPSSPSAGDTIAIKDYAGTFGTNGVLIGRNGENIQGAANDNLLSTNRASVVLVYFDATKGWLYTEESNVGDLQQALFTSATGGTITTSGDFKIHSFTGDGCFVVSTLGNSPTVPTGGPSNVDYLVVAGGGGGANSSPVNRAGGGGGAGGLRTSFPSPGCNAGAFPISATTYPVTVGGGGGNSPGTCNERKGSNSVFSSITSTGGGSGGTAYQNHPCVPGDLTGGSGGGGGGSNSVSIVGAGGTGNTPPVSPPQGNNGGPGGAGNCTGGGGGGGGGHSGGGGTGGNGSGGSAGSPGPGTSNSITGSSVTYSVGGSGGSACGNSPGSAGTANRGNGGGGGNATTGTGGLGGKGIVIIRYKYQ